MQGRRIEVGTVRPDQSMPFGVEMKFPEQVRILERFENRTDQFRLQIDLSGRAVPEMQADRVSGEIVGFDIADTGIGDVGFTFQAVFRQHLEDQDRYGRAVRVGRWSEG